MSDDISSTAPDTPDQATEAGDGNLAPPAPPSEDAENTPESEHGVTAAERALFDPDAVPLPSPYPDADSDEVVPQDRELTFTAAEPTAPKTRAEQFAFLRDAHAGPLVWKGLCLALAHEAPGIPALAPTAHAAAIATPAGERVHQVSALRRGMLVHYFDPHGNPDGHVATVLGWDTPHPTDSLDDVLTWTNDAVRAGGVDVVRASFFPEHWGTGFQFGAISVNGYRLPGYGQVKPPSVGQNVEAAIRATRQAIRWHRAHGHTAVVAGLVAILNDYLALQKRFPKP